MDRTEILSAVRTPLGRFGGALHRRDAVFLATQATRGALGATDLPAESVGALLMGQAHPTGCGPCPARQVALASGLDVPATGIQAGSASGFAALAFASPLAVSQATLALGVEAFGQVPYLLPEARWGRRMGGGRALDAILQDGVDTPWVNASLVERLEILADASGLSRADQEAWARRSHARAEAARGTHRGLLGVATGNRKAVPVQDRDEGLPPGDLEALPLLPGARTLTAGTCAPLADGAAAVLLAPDGTSRPLARILGIQRATHPHPLGALPAIQGLLERTGIALADIDQVEIEETSAIQVLALLQALPDLNPERVNPRGGALALGHAGGAAGLRLVVDLFHHLGPGGLGLAAMSTADGQGIALLLERLK